MNLANRISLFRIFLVPCVVASLIYYHPTRDVLRYVTIGLFILAICSDALDGFIARRLRQRSQLGRILDPIADKLLVLSMIISLSTIHGLPSWMRIPAWFNLIVISRDAILVAGTFLILSLTGHLPVRPSRLGKCAIVSQMAVILAVLVQAPITFPLLVLSAILTISSGIDYIRAGAHHLN